MLGAPALASAPASPPSESDLSEPDDPDGLGKEGICGKPTVGSPEFGEGKEGGLGGEGVELPGDGKDGKDGAPV